MKLLITAATWEEVKPLEGTISQWDEAGLLKNHFIELSITGVGGAATAYHLTKVLAPGNWELVIQLGICGSFNRNYEIGTVVNVTEERFADLGAEDDDQFIDLFEMKLIDANKIPFEEEKLLNNYSLPVISSTLDELPQVKGISVNKVHGNEKSIRLVTSKYKPDVESMEGAAFFYCCKMESIPFIEIRSVSNFVEKRDRSKWNVPLAIEELNKTTAKILREILTLNIQA